jgi:hypothetical protein
MNRAITMLVFVGLLGLGTTAARAAPITIDFEDLPVDQTIGIKYIRNGVVFTGAFIDTADGHRTSPAAHSGLHVAHHFQPEFGAGPMVIEFRSAQTHVFFFGGSAQDTGNVTGTATAFDAGGRMIAQDGPKPLTPSICATLFDLRVGSASISRVEFIALLSSIAIDTAMDDLGFEGNAAPPVPTDTPSVNINSFANGEMIDAASDTLGGTVTGEGLPAEVMVAIDRQRPPGDETPPDILSIPLIGTGTTRNFSSPIRLSLGGQTITVTAENEGGLDGKSSVSIINLPSVIRDGAGSLGALAWAWNAVHCRIAVYASGALATDNVNQFRIDSTMLPKWTAWVLAKSHSGVDHDLFCPTENPRTAIAPTIAQNFRGGRLYFDQIKGALFVPGVFAQAIDTLGGEAATGVPQADPQTSPVAHVWVFQRFARGPTGLPSALEIKGDPPELWVERQGGDLTVLASAGLSLSNSTASISEFFPCSDRQGPCNVVRASSAGRVLDAEHRFCKGTTFGLRPPPAGPDEWVPILGNHTQAVPLLGWVTESRPAGDDDQATHEFPQTHSNGHIWSDWDMFVHPIDPFRDLLAGNNFMEVEFEYYPVQHFFVINGGQPLAGDLYFAAGRWIIDCGHDDFASEIHPPFAMAIIRTIGAPSNPTTWAAIWVNGYYRGDAPIEFRLFPPPRPVPNAFMVVSRPGSSDAAVDVSVIESTNPDFTDSDFSSFVRARFSSTQRPANIGWGGLLPFMSGREYAGIWTIGWETHAEFPVASLSQVWWP